MGGGEQGASQASTHTRLKFQPGTTAGAQWYINNHRTKPTLKDRKLALCITLEAAQFLLLFWVIFNFQLYLGCCRESLSVTAVSFQLLIITAKRREKIKEVIGN